MTEIVVSASQDFSLSPSDRKIVGGPWLHSFIGDIRFIGKNRSAEEENVPILFILIGIIETSLLIRNFGFKTRMIPIPSTDREIEITLLDQPVLYSIKSRHESVYLDIPLSEHVLNGLFSNIVALIADWTPLYRDDRHFVSSNWLLGAALEKSVDRR